MTKDLNKGINPLGSNPIKYNHLNLPTEIYFSATKKINYIYSATGEKLQKIITSGTVVSTVDYLGGFQYLKAKAAAAVVMQFFPTAEGYVNVDLGVYKYVFNYTDHLGNVRLSYTKNEVTGLTVIMEENHYYPFGLKHTNYNTTVMKLRGSAAQVSLTNPYKYKFLGQERQDELGLNWDTFRYRNYDMAIGRFFGVDPVTEEYMSISPYQFAHNNPVWKIELEGLEGQPTTNQDIVNREPVYMTTNIIVNTMENQSSKPQNSRPGVPMLRMGIGIEKSSSRSAGNEFGQVNGTATAYKANIGLAVCIDGDRIEYGITAGQVNGDATVAGQNVAEGQFTTFNAEGSYNMKNGDQQLNIQSFTGEISGVNGQNKEADTKVGINGLGAYIEANLTEAGNNMKDFGNLIMSYLKGVAQDYFNKNNTSGTDINPVR